jgi:predicted NUDIX family phosphoesterase
MKNILCIPMDKIRPFLEAGRATYIDGAGVKIVELLREHAVWIDRPKAEEDANYRQVIPYITIKNTVLGKRLLMTRMNKQGEARLHGKEYIGVGGHIDQQQLQPDGEWEEPGLHCLAQAAYREIGEETEFTDVQINYLGVICIDGDGASMVDRVHVGVVYDATTTQEKFGTEEADLHNHRWATDDELRAAFPNAEAWTQCVLRDFLKLV